VDACFCVLNHFHGSGEPILGGHFQSSELRHPFIRPSRRNRSSNHRGFFGLAGEACWSQFLVVEVPGPPRLIGEERHDDAGNTSAQHGVDGPSTPVVDCCHAVG